MIMALAYSRVMFSYNILQMLIFCYYEPIINANSTDISTKETNKSSVKKRSKSAQTGRNTTNVGS
jgi:hypothetical protein